MAVNETLRPRQARWRWLNWSEIIYRLYIIMVLIFIFLPIVVTIRYAFGTARYFVWPPTGFTLDWFDKAFHNPLLIEAFKNSIVIALATTALSTVLGTITAFALARVAFKGKDAMKVLVLLPIVTYGIVGAISLLIFFNFIDFERGLLTAIFGHTTFLFPFVVVVVGARLANFDVSLEEASMDLGGQTGQDVFRYYAASDYARHHCRSVVRIHAVLR